MEAEIHCSRFVPMNKVCHKNWSKERLANVPLSHEESPVAYEGSNLYLSKLLWLSPVLIPKLLVHDHKPGFSVGFQKQESQRHLLEKVRVPLCKFDEILWKIGVPSPKLGVKDWKYGVHEKPDKPFAVINSYSNHSSEPNYQKCMINIRNLVRFCHKASDMFLLEILANAEWQG